MKRILSALMIVLMLVPGLAACKRSTAEMSIYFLDCGQGDAVFITSGNATMLVDAGKASNVQKVSDFLDGRGIHTLDYVFSSHPDEDHIGGMPVIYERYQVNNSIYPSYKASSAIYRKYMAAIENEPNSEASLAEDDDSWELGTVRIDVVSDGQGYSNANDASVVLKVTNGETSLLLTGDISQKVESDLIASKDMDIDILKVAHHGSASSSSAEFLAETSPKVAVISVGEGNSYGHPTQAALTRLGAVCANVYRTDRDGTVLLEVNGDQITSNDSALEGAEISYCTARIVYVTSSGKKYHAKETCSNIKNATAKSLSAAEEANYTACSKCVPSDFESQNLPHTFGEFVYNNDATAKKDGTKTRTCFACKSTQTVTAEGTRLPEGGSPHDN